MGENLERAAEQEHQERCNKILKNLQDTESEDLFILLEEVNYFLKSFNRESLLTSRQHDLLEEVKLYLYRLGFN
jgi:hypothetical protein